MRRSKRKLSGMPRIPTGSVYQPKNRDRKGRRVKAKVWWIKYYKPGQAKPVREPARTESREEAVELLRQRMANLGKVETVAAKVTIGQLLDGLIANYERQLKKSTYDVKRKVEAQLRPYFGALQASQLTTAKVEAYMAKRLKDGVVNGSINRELAALRRALSLGMKQDPPLVTRIPHWEKLPEAEAREGVLDHETYLKVRELLPGYARLALVLGYHTGARRGELLAIRRQDVDMKAGRINLPGRKTKSGKQRYLPIYGDMAAEIEAAIMAADKVAQEKRRKPCPHLIQDDGLPVATFRKSWNTACKLAGVPQQLFHDLRRTALTNMMDAGLSEKEAMEISGHRTRYVFERYHIVSDKRMKLNAEKLGTHLAKREEEARRKLAAEQGGKPQ